MWTGEAVEKQGNFERLARAKVMRMLEKRDMQERGMHAQLVGHAYAGVAASLARAAAGMCCERPLEVRLPELALDQAADLLARPDGIVAFVVGAANRNVYGGETRNLC